MTTDSARTVVAWDGSPEAGRALDWAIARATPTSGAVVIARIVDDSFFNVISRDMAEESIHDSLHELEEQVARILGSAPHIPVATEILRGDPRSGLSAMTGPETLLVLGTSDATAPFHRKPWSLARTLIATARGPLVVVPAQDRPPGFGVVVCADAGPEGHAARRFAEAEHRDVGEPLIVFPPGAAADVDLVASAFTARLLVVGTRDARHLTDLLISPPGRSGIAEVPCPVVLIGPLAASSLQVVPRVPTADGDLPVMTRAAARADLS